MSPSKLYIVNLLFSFIPATRMFGVKRLLLRWAGAKIGNNVRIVSSVRVLGVGELTIGENTFIGHFTKILVGGGVVKIGRDVDISSNVTIINGTHNLYDIPRKAAGTGLSKNIKIGDGSWICASVTIIGGARLGDCSIIASGATVVSEVPSYCLFGGVPAKFLKNYKETNYL